MTEQGKFRDEEFVILSHFDKREGKWVETVYPIVGGRLRLAHEENEQLSITSEIIQYDESSAVVRATAKTSKGEFTGLGMASSSRDKTIAPAILELAETRSIARALRFAGYGVEYCGAEEISHLTNGQAKEPDAETSDQEQNGDNGNGNGNGRISNRQLKYIVTLGKNLNLDSKDLDKNSEALYGLKMNGLTVKDASSFIEELKGREAVLS